ncbi:bifunctional Cyclin-Cyclin-like subunit Ssn8/Cyclin-like/Cyclin [Babesia duncani]|uniref:Bifunctional Cyclin-Cyclin-like subunit Ssn8/Cyclin-like/Cyclin n=1 Tax=Babesia duncani TaxID=323732 RepID=A0AAD9UNY6_9APIC|nr:bifunctional Cyclin-Cyclin-like subunit Ssn8/Cyclin-like/Cyclin [Babesia duncani]
METNQTQGGLKWPLTSTHYQNWLLPSIDKLREIQLATFERAVSKVKEKGISLEMPTIEDEKWLIKYYSFQMHNFLSLHNIKTYVTETALTYFNRFYLKRSLLEYDPRIIMFTCITLAIKLEDMWRTFFVDRLLGSVDDLDITKVFDMESTVCDVLNFNFMILHTADALHTLRTECYTHLKDTLGLDDDILKEHINLILSIYKDAELDCAKMQENSEFLFLYTPPQLATANFIHYCKTKLDAILSVETFISSKLLNNDIAKLENMITMLDSLRVCFICKFIIHRHVMNHI